MDKLEQYLDQVCRGIGGPIEMRQHVRQELREHLLDAIAQHKAAGLSDDVALEQALQEFGKPEEVRSELESAHGQRMTWIIDKAMQWKEKTMKAKWLWVSWAYLGLVLVIFLQVNIITFQVLFIFPKFEKLMSDGIIDPAILDEAGPRWMFDYLRRFSYIAGHHTLLCFLVPAAGWGLFEWRVRSENKSYMRLSALGTAAVALTILVGLMAGSLVITFCLGVAGMGRIAQSWSVQQVATIESSVDALEKAGAKNDWKAMEEPADKAMKSLNSLSAAPALPALKKQNEQPSIEALRANLKASQESFRAVQQAIQAEDAIRLEKELRSFRKAFEPLREASKKQVP